MRHLKCGAYDSNGFCKLNEDEVITFIYFPSNDWKPTGDLKICLGHKYIVYYPAEEIQEIGLENIVKSVLEDTTYTSVFISKPTASLNAFKYLVKEMNYNADLAYFILPKHNMDAMWFLDNSMWGISKEEIDFPTVGTIDEDKYTKVKNKRDQIWKN